MTTLSDIASNPSDAAAVLSSFEALDREFAGFLLRLAKNNSPQLALAAALVSRSTRAGHVCLDLREPIEGEDDGTGERALKVPPLEEWRTVLGESSVVGKPGEFKPLILDPAGRLYLQRYWNYETTVANAIKSRLKPESSSNAAAATTELSRILDRYFPASADSTTDWQRVAVQTAVTHPFTVISGGPGTGKTHTIAVLLAVLMELSPTHKPRIALTAPTGKAAVRLQEAIQNAHARLPAPAEIRNRISATASTLHRLLGAAPGSAAFAYDAARLLPFDMVIIDEASMVDLALMAKLFAACAPTTRIVLVGDMNQLASVEAGAVLGDVCHGLRHRRSQTRPDQSRPPLAACIVELQKNYRFRDDDEISGLSFAINRGDADTALRLLKSSSTGAVRCRAVPSANQIGDVLGDTMARHFERIARGASPSEGLTILADFRILCALRKGPFGSEAINARIEKILREAGLIASPTPFYPGRPILVLKNDYNLRLYNGDVGIILPHPVSQELRAWFLDAEGQVRDFATGRLPEHETVFAMTVHKSQGSEFQHVLLILPDRDSPVLSRELIYTGATRARRGVEIWLNEGVFHTALARQIRRRSGLSDRLWE